MQNGNGNGNDAADRRTGSDDLIQAGGSATTHAHGYGLTSRTQSERADSMDADGDGSVYDETGGKNGSAGAGGGTSSQARRDQNRIAQREFRARKQQHIKDLEARIAILSGNQDERTELMSFVVRHVLAENAQLRRTVKQLAAFIGEGLATSLPRIGLTLDSLDAFVNRPESETAHEAFEALKAAKARQPPPNANLNGPPKPNSIFDFLPSSKPQHHHGQGGGEGSGTTGGGGGGGGKRKRASTSNTEAHAGGGDDRQSSRADSLGADPAGKSTSKQKRKSSMATARRSAPGSPAPEMRDSPRRDAGDSSVPTRTPMPLPRSFMDEPGARRGADGDYTMFDEYIGIMPNARQASQLQQQRYQQHSTTSSISSNSAAASIPRRATVPVPANEQRPAPPTPPSQPQSMEDQAKAYLRAFNMPEFGVAFDRPDLKSFPSDQGPARDAHPLSTSPVTQARSWMSASGGREFALSFDTAEEQDIANMLLERCLTTMTGRQAEAFQLITYHMDNWRQNPNYRLPPSLQPTTVQQHMPHESIIDGVIFPSLRSKMILLRGKFDLLQAMSSFMTGFLVRGEDTLDHNCWEVTEDCLRENVMLLDAEVLTITNKWREQRGEPPLDRHDLLNPPKY